MIKQISNDGSEQNYEYDNNSNVTSYKLVKDENVKNLVEYEYNNINRLTSINNNGILTSYSYDANGNITNKKLSSGVTTSYTYNKAGLLTSMESKHGSEVYTYSNCNYLLNGLLQSVYMPYDGYENDGGVKLYSEI